MEIKSTDVETIVERPFSAHSGSIFKGARKNFVFLLLAYKLFILALPLVYAQFRPASFSNANYNVNFHWPENKEISRAERFMTWDGEHYLYLSANGYKAGSMSNAFYPLWPALIYAATKLMFGHSLIAALVMSNLLSFVACLLLHWLVSETYGRECADRTLLLLLAFPGALFFQFPYSESLFLLLIVLFFIGILRQNSWLVALMGFLLPMTGVMGVFCLFPLGWYLWERAIRRQKLNSCPFRMAHPPISLSKAKALSLCAAPIFGFATYFAVMYVFTGDPLSGFEAQRINQPSLTNVLNLPMFITVFFNIGLHHGMWDSPIDRAFFILFLACLPAIWRLNKMYFLYALCVGLFPAMSNWFFSYTRLLVVCFPLFIVLSKKLSGLKNRLALTCVFLAFGIVQVLFIIRHINFEWAG